MGSPFPDWADAIANNTAYYVGLNTSFEVIWTVVAVALCVVALVAGSKHELDAYKKVEKK